jgi:hypothetical protein
LTKSNSERLTELEYKAALDDAIDTSVWPDSLITIANIIGPAAALVLCEHCGGLRGFYVAHEAKPTAEWAKVIGFDRYSKLCAALGGQKIDIPRFAFRTLKKQTILELAKDPELSKRQIALRAHVTEGYVQLVLNGIERTNNQLELFGDTNEKK